MLAFAERQFDVFLTIDKQLEFQNALIKSRLGFVIVRVKSSQLASFLPFFPEILNAATSVRPGQVIYIGAPMRRR